MIGKATDSGKKQKPEGCESEDQANKQANNEEQPGDNGQYRQQNPQGGLQADLTEEIQDPNPENRL